MSKLIPSQLASVLLSLVPSFAGQAWLALVGSCSLKLVVKKKFGDMGVELDYYVFEFCPFYRAKQYRISNHDGSFLSNMSSNSDKYLVFILNRA